MIDSENSDIAPTLNKFGQYFAVMEAIDMGIPCTCGKELEFSPQMYEHSGGIAVPDKVKKQWVYITCDKCGYENSHKKILMRARRLYNV